MSQPKTRVRLNRKEDPLVIPCQPAGLSFGALVAGEASPLRRKPACRLAGNH